MVLGSVYLRFYASIKEYMFGGAGGGNHPPPPNEQKLTYSFNHEDDIQS